MGYHLDPATRSLHCIWTLGAIRDQPPRREALNRCFRAVERETRALWGDGNRIIFGNRYRLTTLVHLRVIDQVLVLHFLGTLKGDLGSRKSACHALVGFNGKADDLGHVLDVLSRGGFDFRGYGEAAVVRAALQRICKHHTRMIDSNPVTYGNSIVWYLRSSIGEMNATVYVDIDKQGEVRIKSSEVA